jgi:hypothetical protein
MTIRNGDIFASTDRGTKAAPPVRQGDLVVVRTERFSCLAFRDATGKWRNYYHPEEVLGHVEEVPLT